MTRKFNIFFWPTVLAITLIIAGCDSGPSSLELAAQRLEEQRTIDQKERAALVEQMKAAAVAQEKKQEPINKLQIQIDALDQQINDARSKGKDWRALEKTQEALEVQKYELQRQ
ncbi:MAG: hypothetical protein QOI34_94 [Verrucomicrobiota bacterium]